MKKKLMMAVVFCLLICMLCGCSPKVEQSMSPEQLMALSDNELFETVYLRLINTPNDKETALERIPPACWTVYVLNMYDMEIQNGGLCQFFVNPSRALAPHVAECLEAVGAQEHLQLFSGFIESNGVDLNNLSFFLLQDVEEFAEQAKRYDFESFDDSYYDLPPLYDYIVAYIRANITEFS